MEFANLSTLGTRLSLNLIPVSMTIELTEQCCLNCIHCARNITYRSASGLKEHRPGELASDQWKSVLYQLRQAGTLEITLTGGEPLLYNGFFDLLDYAVKLKFAVTLFTNGFLIDKKVARILKKSSIRQVQISIYSCESKIHDFFTGCWFYWFTSCRGLP